VRQSQRNQDEDSDKLFDIGKMGENFGRVCLGINFSARPPNIILYALNESGKDEPP
jgi:hypothetical protein